ncbi:hypothetical protein ACJJTC_011041 [Scirpophaga incertulas]
MLITSKSSRKTQKLLQSPIQKNDHRMNVKLKILVITFNFALGTESKVQLDNDLDKLNNTKEYLTTVEGQHINKRFHKNITDIPDFNRSSKEDKYTMTNKHKYPPEEVISLLKLLSSLVPKNDKDTNDKGRTKITLNIRNIQNGFTNSGKRYHIGNTRREFRRSKRENNYWNNAIDFDIDKQNSVVTNSDVISDENTISIETGKDISTNDTTENFSTAQETTACSSTNVKNEYLKLLKSATHNYEAINGVNNNTSSKNNRSYAFRELGTLLSFKNYKHHVNECKNNNFSTKLNKSSTTKSSVTSNDTRKEIKSTNTTYLIQNKNNTPIFSEIENKTTLFQIDTEKKSAQKGILKKDRVIESKYTDILNQDIRFLIDDSSLDDKLNIIDAQ